MVMFSQAGHTRQWLGSTSESSRRGDAGPGPWDSVDGVDPGERGSVTDWPIAFSPSPLGGSVFPPRFAREFGSALRTRSLCIAHLRKRGGGALPSRRSPQPSWVTLVHRLQLAWRDPRRRSLPSRGAGVVPQPVRKGPVVLWAAGIRIDPVRSGLASFRLGGLGKHVAVLPEPHPYEAEEGAHEAELPGHAPRARRMAFDPPEC